MKNLRGSVGGFPFREMIAHSSDNPEVQGRYIFSLSVDDH